MIDRDRKGNILHVTVGGRTMISHRTPGVVPPLESRVESERPSLGLKTLRDPLAVESLDDNPRVATWATKDRLLWTTYTITIIVSNESIM